ncbi:Putative DnaJ subfamily C, member 28 domain-containing protein [Septoria linicola]|uniref:DnaJ subfamily C, member 28 domain-containing protein n=1 Tax=Septoria linicola TaxID=215465 RepID=A0A9Q9EJB3_9PEZI|nr:Putative DnaJ subfamily C, member 28 domain-containing protein [Septoria linicola]
MLSRTAWPIRVRCLRPRGPVCSSRYDARYASGGGSPPNAGARGDGEHAPVRADEEQEKGAFTQKLEHISEESLLTGGRSARKAVEETGGSGFSENLRRELEAKIAAADFKNEHAAAISEANLPATAPKHVREIAASKPWRGTESVEDATLRMLNDAHRPAPRGPPRKVDTGRPKSRANAGTRLASAREKVTKYTSDDVKGMTDEERERFRREVKDRFQPGARHVVASVQGVISLANQRIEDAIARGQFKNLPRGRKIERDHNASSPFIDTTTYLMNKMIKKQDIVPPWIEKQQEVITTANVFRRRLRSDWKRHVSRIITSRGGSFESHVRLAEEYAFAESLENPSKEQIEKMNAIDSQGHLSQITISGQLTPGNADDATQLDEEIKVLEQRFNDDGSLKSPDEQVKVAAEHVLLSQAPPPDAPRMPSVAPFRDEAWEKTELSYHTLAVKELNDLTRSYNLMAPNLAKKPYFSLERELKSCFADVAPQVAAAIRDRALAPRVKGVEVIGHKAGSVLEKFAMDRAGHVHDERKPQYGFKEFWRDLFAPKT